VRSGNFVYFDNTTHTIRPEHVMAVRCRRAFLRSRSKASTTGDGGLVSNTPLQWVVVAQPRRDTLAFQVDLWSASGEFPRNMLEVITRENEIRYSSRTRAATDQFKHIQRLRGAAAGLLPRCYRGARARYVGTEYGSLAVSPWKCARLLKGLNLNHRQIVEAALIRAEAIGRTEPHPEVAMQDQAERFPTVIASHGFNMRQNVVLGAAFEVPVSPITQN
jgi:hypothetical protein